MSAQDGNEQHGMPRSAARLFIDREYAAIRGRRSSVLWALYAIVLGALLAIVFGKAALSHLHEKMEDPFTSTVTIPVQNARYYGKYAAIRTYLDSCARVSAFGVESSSGNHTTGWFIWSPGLGQDLYTYVHSFGYHHDRALLDRIIGDDNLVADLSGGRLADPSIYADGLIISQPMLDELGLDTADLRGRSLLVRSGAYTLPLRVLAVTRTLPAKAKAYCEHTLLRGLDDREAQGTIATDDADRVTVLLNASIADTAAQGEIWREALRMAIPEARDIRFRSAPDMATHRIAAEVELTRRMPFHEGPRYYQEKLNDGGGLPAGLEPRLLWRGRFKDPAPDPADGSEGAPYTNLTATFSSLDGIEAFQRDIFRREHVELDLDHVESKKNFAVISGLGAALIVALQLFAVLAVTLFLFNTLKNHLERIQMNIGTFLAFGIPERFLLSGYLRIIFRLVVRVSLLSMATLLVAQAVILLLLRMGIRLPEMFQHIQVLDNAWLYLALAIMSATCYLILRRRLRKFLSRPPGDLIYART